MIQGAIFDMDGLMLDTEPIWGSSWKPVLARRGIEFIPGQDDAVRGTAGERMLSIIRSYYGEDVDAAAIWDEVQDEARSRILRGVPKKAGLDELLGFLADEGVPMAVASSSPRDLIEKNLGNAGVSDCFSVVLSGSEVARSKPDPDIFLEAARRLGTDPGRTLVLEDSLSGVRAGHAGGFVTVMVPDLVAPDDEIATLWTACCASLLEVRDLIASGSLG